MNDEALHTYDRLIEESMYKSMGECCCLPLGPMQECTLNEVQDMIFRSSEPLTIYRWPISFMILETVADVS